jgi:hypothetical protein
MAETTWFVGVNREQRGPFPEEEVKAMIARREVTARNHVWSEGMESWQRVGEVEAFAEAVREATPPPRPLPGLAYVKDLWADLRAILAAPDEGLAAAVDKKRISAYFVWMALGVIVFALLALQATPAIRQAVKPDLSRGGIFVRALAHGIILYAIWFAALMVTLVPILRSQAGWQEALAVLGLSSIPPVLVGIVVFALVWLHPVFYALGAVGVPLKVLFAYHLLLHGSKASRRAIIYAMPAMALAVMIVYGLLAFAMSA